jgi:HAD superfamily hydrolase (TIGR01458 family)
LGLPVSASHRDLRGIEGLILDIDGVLAVSWKPLPGAVEALASLRSGRLPIRLLTNTTELTRTELLHRLHRAGFGLEREDVVTAPVLTASYLRSQHPGARCFVLSAVDLAEDLEGVELVGDRADVVVVGGATDPFSAGEMNRAFRMVLDGAALVAMHRSMAWMTEQGMTLDAGVMLVAALEEATGRPAVVCGKPSPECFRQALSLLGLPADRAAMVGDDIRSDILPAQESGMTGVLVRTGKFRAADLERSDHRPDVVLDSVAELPDLLGLP